MRLLNKFVALLLYVAAFVLIVATAALALVRLAAPYIDEFQSQIEAAAGEALGRGVSLGSIDAAWRHFKPHLELADVAITLEEGNVLEFSRVVLGFDLPESLRQRRLVSNEIRLSGFELGLQRDADERWHVLGVGASKSSPQADGYQALAGWLSQQRQLVLENATVHFSDASRPGDSLVLSHATAYLLNDKQQHHLALQVELPPALGGRVEAVVDFDGVPLLDDGWRAKAYLHAERLAVAGLSRQLTSSDLMPATVKGGTVGLHAWLQLGANGVDRIEGRLAGGNFRLAARAGEGLVRETVIGELTADFAAEQHRQDWFATVTPLRFSGVGADANEIGLTLAYLHEGEGAKRLVVETGSQRLEALTESLRNLPLFNAAQTKQLRELQAAGEISKTVLQWSWAGAAGAVFAAALEFKDVALQASEALPGIDSLRGSMVYENSSMLLRLAGEQVVFDGHQWFRQPLLFEHVNGEVRWTKTPQTSSLFVRDIAVSNNDLALGGSIALHWPDAGQAPLIDMALALERADIGQRSLYLPARIMHEKAVSWFDRALKGGRIEGADIRLHGPADLFPYKAGGGEFSIKGHIVDASLDYQADWPSISGIDADLQMQGAKLMISARAGTLFDTHISPVQATFDDVTARPARLKIVGKAAGPAADGLKFLTQSPLRQRFAENVRLLQIDGRGDLDLKLDISIPGKDVVVEGAVTLAGNRLSVADATFVAGDIDGVLRFNNEGLHGEAIGADVFGMRTAVDIEPLLVDGKRGSRFRGRGKSDVSTYARVSGLPWLAEHAVGESLWNAELRVLAATPPELVIESSLRGIDSRFPHPFDKAANQARVFRLQTQLPFGKAPINLSYGSDVEAELAVAVNATGQRSLQWLDIGVGAPVPGRRDGITVEGKLERLVLDEWLALAGGVGEGDGGKVAELPALLQLQVERLEMAARYWNSIKLDARRRAGDWHVDVDGEGLKGVVASTGTGAGRRLLLTMNELVLVAVDTQASAEEKAIDPRQLPTLDFRAEKFRYADYDLGSVSFVTNRVKQGQRFDNIIIDAPSFSLRGAGNWTLSGGEARSSYDLSLETSNLGKMLRQLGYAADNVRGGKTNVAVNVFWAGSPANYRHEKLNGKLKLSVRDIRFSDIDPGAGRIFGLLSVQTLPRRLTLDFKDLFREGIQMDTIEGSFSIKDGDAFTDDLSLRGPATRIDIVGRIGIAARDYDQVMAVTPEVTSSLPIVGAVVGGPGGAGVGAAIMLLHKLFNPKLLHYNYQVTGPWQNPTVVLIKDAEKPPASGERQ